MVIREYKEGDVDEIIGVWWQASHQAHHFLSPDFLRWEEEKIREVYLPSAETFVLVDQGSVVGFISMFENEIGALFIHPAKQGQGKGRALLDHVLLLHKELDVEVFEKNFIGRSFYDKNGFVILQRYLHEPTNQVLLRMRLSK